MQTLFPCPSCERHVRADHARRAEPCPFCDAPLPGELAEREAPGGRWRWATVTAAAVASGLSTLGLACDGSSVSHYGAPCLPDACTFPDFDSGLGDARIVADATVSDGALDAAQDAFDAADAGENDAAPDATDAASD